MPSFENVSDQPEADANRSKGKGHFNILRGENKKLEISSKDRRGEHILKVLEKLEILKDSDTKPENIRIEEGKIELLNDNDNDKGKAYKTLNKQDNPVQFMEFEYKLRERLVEDKLRESLVRKDLSDKLSGKITEVEKREGVYTIKCKETTAEGGETVKEYKIKEKDGRYHLFEDNNDDSLGDVQDRVQSWENTIRSLKLEVRNIQISEELEEAVKGAILSKGKYMDIDGKEKGAGDAEKTIINDGRIVDYDKENHIWAIRTEDGKWCRIQLSTDEEKKIEDMAAANVLEKKEDQVRRTDKGIYQVNEGDGWKDISPDQMKSIESDARIANVSFTEKEGAVESRIDMMKGNDEKLKSLESDFERWRLARKILLYALQGTSLADLLASQGSANIDGALASLTQMQPSQNQGQFVEQQQNQMFTDSYRQFHQRKNKVGRKIIAEYNKTGIVISKEDAKKQLEGENGI